MPRFFFDVLDGTNMLDTSGMELPDPKAARKEASRRAAELLCNAPDRIWRDGDWTVWVRDERGLRLFSVVIFSTTAAAGREPELDAFARH